MKIKKNINRLRTAGVLAVLILAVVTAARIDTSLGVFAANTVPDNIAQSVAALPETPCNPVSAGTVTSVFGERTNPITEKEEFHNGTDIAAAEGTPIRLMFSGTVAEVGENEIYGRYVLVEHPNELYTRYCHCSRVLVKTGYNLKKGELVALVGSTGWSTGPHLHLEVISNGKYCDPEWLVEW